MTPRSARSLPGSRHDRASRGDLLRLPRRRGGPAPARHLRIPPLHAPQGSPPCDASSSRFAATAATARGVAQARRVARAAHSTPAPRRSRSSRPSVTSRAASAPRGPRREPVVAVHRPGAQPGLQPLQLGPRPGGAARRHGRERGRPLAPSVRRDLPRRSTRPRRTSRRCTSGAVQLLPDGHLLVIFEGIGIARLDRDSRVVWGGRERSPPRRRRPARRQPRRPDPPRPTSNPEPSPEASDPRGLRQSPVRRRRGARTPLDPRGLPALALRAVPRRSRPRAATSSTPTRSRSSTAGWPSARRRSSPGGLSCR